MSGGLRSLEFVDIAGTALTTGMSTDVIGKFYKIQTLPVLVSRLPGAWRRKENGRRLVVV